MRRSLRACLVTRRLSVAASLFACLLLAILAAVVSGCRGGAQPGPLAHVTPPIVTAAGTPVSLTAMEPHTVPTKRLTSTPTASPTPQAPSLDQTENILVLGVDRRENARDPSWRTDSIMVVGIDRPGGRVGIVSIPRDLYVEIPGLGQSRINEADYFGESTSYPGGGPALLQRVLTETLGIPTDHYVRIQMQALGELVDAMGGVTVTLESPLYERTPDSTSPNGVQEWTLPAGDVWLDGETAQKFARFRYVTSDFGRARRQQQLIWAIRDRALQLDMVPQIPAMYRALSDAFETDLSLLELIRLAQFGIRLDATDVRGLVLGTEALEYSITEQGGSVLVIADEAKLREQLAGVFEGPALATLGNCEVTGCPSPPPPVPTFTPTPTATETVMPGSETPAPGEPADSLTPELGDEGAPPATGPVPEDTTEPSPPPPDQGAAPTPAPEESPDTTPVPEEHVDPPPSPGENIETPTPAPEPPTETPGSEPEVPAQPPAEPATTSLP